MMIETKLNITATATIRIIMLLVVVAVMERGERGIKPKKHK